MKRRLLWAVLIRKWFEEVWHQGREEVIDAMCAKDAIGYGQAQHGADIHGSQHFKQFWRGFRDAFSNLHLDIHDPIEGDGDEMVVARCTMAMTTPDFFRNSTLQQTRHCERY